MDPTEFMFTQMTCQITSCDWSVESIGGARNFSLSLSQPFLCQSLKFLLDLVQLNYLPVHYIKLFTQQQKWSKQMKNSLSVWWSIYLFEFRSSISFHFICHPSELNFTQNGSNQFIDWTLIRLWFYKIQLKEKLLRPVGQSKSPKGTIFKFYLHIFLQLIYPLSVIKERITFITETRNELESERERERERERESFLILISLFFEIEFATLMVTNFKKFNLNSQLGGQFPCSLCFVW